MPAGKDRLYVALYVRGGSPKMPGMEDQYHWAILLGPKIEHKGSEGHRCHAKERLRSIESQQQENSVTVWGYEERTIQMAPTAMILIRVVVGKVKDKDRLLTLLNGIPIQEGRADWNCVEWVKDALRAVENDKKKVLSSSVLSWESVRESAMRYCADKRAQKRFDGSSKWNKFKVPTFDLIQGKEIQE